MDPAPSGSSAQADARLDELDRHITMLRAAYERYFHGADRTPPTQQREQVVRLLHRLEHKTTLVGTAQKFRLRTLVQAFQTYRRYWDRTCKEIEEGTYRRDVLKAQRRMEYKKKREARLDDQEDTQTAQGVDDQGSFSLDFDLDELDDLDAFAQSILNAQPAPAPVAPIPRPPPEDDARRRQKLMDIQRKLGLQVTGLDDSTPTPAAAEQQRRAKLEQMRQKLDAPRSTPAPAAPALPEIASAAEGLGDSPSAVRRAKLERLRSRIGSHASATMGAPRPLSATSGEHRVVQRRVKPVVAQAAEDPVAQVYKNLIEAKRRCNEPTQGLSYENVAQSMAKQRERYREKGAKDVEFKVVIKEGKAFLKPEPK